MKLVMAMKVRDEADVIEQNLRYHHAQGTDQFIVTDNELETGLRPDLGRTPRLMTPEYQDEKL